MGDPFSSACLSRYDALSLGQAMKQRDKAAKTRRRKPLTPKTSQAPDPNHFSPASEEKNVARLSRELNEAFEQQPRPPIF
jgi:hypothetical protein